MFIKMGDKASSAALVSFYYKRISRFVWEVDQYVRKYVDYRDKEESPEAFQYRFWKWR